MRGFRPFTDVNKLDPEGLLRTIRRQGTPVRVHFMELFQDRPVEDAIDRTFGVTRDLDHSAPDYEMRRWVAMQRFLGYEYVPCGLLELAAGNWAKADDTAQEGHAGGLRGWVDESRGPITTWEEFEKFPWPDGKTWNTWGIEWFEKNLPDDMMVIGRQGHFCEYLCWLMGYETLCIALIEQRDLVTAMARRILDLEMAATAVLLQSRRVKMLWASDDLGFKTGLMFGPADMREFVLSGHKKLAAMAHEAGMPYLLHACGKRASIIEDLIGDVKLDAIHSWEDTIELITDAKRNYGQRLSLIGGIDVDFLCRSSEEFIRERVRETVRICQPGGGFCLGTGNTVANYIPVENYLVMLDEGRKY